MNVVIWNFILYINYKTLKLKRAIRFVSNWRKTSPILGVVLQKVDKFSASTGGILARTIPRPSELINSWRFPYVTRMSSAETNDSQYKHPVMQQHLLPTIHIKFQLILMSCKTIWTRQSMKSLIYMRVGISCRWVATWSFIRDKVDKWKSIP